MTFSEVCVGHFVNVKLVRETKRLISCNKLLVTLYGALNPDIAKCTEQESRSIATMCHNRLWHYKKIQIDRLGRQLSSSRYLCSVRLNISLFREIEISSVLICQCSLHSIKHFEDYRSLQSHAAHGGSYRPSIWKLKIWTDMKCVTCIYHTPRLCQIHSTGHVMHSKVTRDLGCSTPPLPQLKDTALWKNKK
jgi:hypothetical protein